MIRSRGATAVIKEEEATRLKGRYSNVDLFKQLQDSSSSEDDPKARASHCCYIHLVGIIPDFENRLGSNEIESEIPEMYIKDVVLYQNVAALAEKRNEYAVFEDNFGSILEKMLHGQQRPSYRSLYEACSEFDKECHMQMHTATSKRSHVYFIQKNVSKDDALACAFAIAFYTGTYSETVNRNAVMLTRNENRNASTNVEASKVNTKAAIIMYYLVQGLSYIDFYWGIATRGVHLTAQEIDDYQPGSIITWLQFSSANRGHETTTWFSERNTTFIIYSLTGRSIQQFSNCSEDEDEILFLPHSSFLVCNVESKSNRYRIYLRQIELGLCQYVVLWVDDHIFDDWWENKELMERASTVGTGVNVHFIPKSNTESALCFLSSEFGSRLKQSQTFRIVTDMNRDNEASVDDAGIRLINEVRKLGFNNECLIFTGNASSARKKLNKAMPQSQQTNITISESTVDLNEFVLFQ